MTKWSNFSELAFNYLFLFFHAVYLLFTPQYLERELRMEGLPFPYSFEVCDMMELQGWVNSFLHYESLLNHRGPSLGLCRVRIRVVADCPQNSIHIFG